MRKTLVTLFVILIINFFMPRIMPGDPFDFLSVEDGSTIVTLTEEQIQHYRSYYGMDKTMLRQFTDYISNILKGDFGKSIYYNRPVTEMVFERIAWTLFLVISALVVSSLSGTLLGMLSAYSKNDIRHLDGILVRIMTVISEIPDFILGLLLLFIFAAKLRWFPLSGGITPFAEHSSTGIWIMDYLKHAILPGTVLILTSLGDFFLLSRQSMIGILREPYIQTARAKGLSQWKILIHHALLNAFSPIVSKIFMQMGMMLGGAVLVENVFAYPGIGRLMREAVSLRDYVMIQGIFFYVAIFVLIFNFIADLIFKKANKKEVV